MDDPELRSDETILVRTSGILVKSIPFEGILTNKRILLVDKAKNLLPPKEISLATIKDVDTGENAIRDQIITISIIATTGETRQMILTFSRQVGGNRIRERDEWAKFLKERTTSTFMQAVRKVLPGHEQDGREAAAPSSPRIEIVNSPIKKTSHPSVRSRTKKEIESVQPVKRIIETGPATSPVPIMKREPEPTAEPASPGFGLFCSRCGNKVMEGSAFCNRCGSRIVAPVSPAAREELPVPASRAEAPLRAEPREVQAVYPAGEEMPTSSNPDVREAITIPYDPIEEALAAEEASEAPDFQFVNEPADEQPQPAPAQAPAQKKKKAGGKSFISRLFSPKELSSKPLNPKSMPTAPLKPPKKPQKPGKTGGFRPGKKTVIAAVIVVILVIVVVTSAVFLLPMLSKGGEVAPSGNTGNSPSTTVKPGANPTVVSSQTMVPRVTAQAIAPVTGVFVHINYLASWKGTYGMTSDIQSIADSGDKWYEVFNATGTVQASIAKLDSSTRHDLLVEIYKDGKLLTSGSTGASFGSVTLSVDVNTGVAQAPKTSAGTTPAPTAVHTTASVTAAKTTAPVLTTTKTTTPTTTAAH